MRLPLLNLCAAAALLTGGCVSAGEPLRIAARPDVVEVAPLLAAAAHLGARRAVVVEGSVLSLSPSPAGATADLAGNAETQALRASLTNPDLRIIMTVAEGHYRIVGRRSSGISGPGDLRGKRIATMSGTSAAYFLHRMLASEGLSEADIIVTPMAPSAMVRAVEERQVDAIAIWEPISNRALERLGADGVAFGNPQVYRELYNLNVNAALLANPASRAEIVALVRSLVIVSADLEHPTVNLLDRVADHSGYTPAEVAASWPHLRFPAALPPDLLDILVAQEAWLAAASGREPRPRPELARLIDASIIEEARAVWRSR